MDFILKFIFAAVYLAYKVLADVPNDTGWHLAHDRVVAKARRLFQIPHEDAGRDLEVNMDGQLQYDTWQRSNGVMSFPEVAQQYSWRKFSRPGFDRNRYDGHVRSIFKTGI